MGFITSYPSAIATYLADRVRYGLAETQGPLDREVVFVLDGVGGSQAAPLAVRRALKMQGSDVGSILFRWQTPVPGDFLRHLMWLRRNRLMGLKLARRILEFRRSHRRTPLHLVAFSGGVGIAVFACEQLAGRGGLETLVMVCPALSPDYNLARALRSVMRCYALVSQRDRLILGMGTRLFGTTDRQFQAAAGYVGFRIPEDVTSEEISAYSRLHLIRWTPKLRPLGHYGGHMGWARVPFLLKHLLPMLHGEPDLSVEAVKPA